MKCYTLILFMLFPALLKGQIISTFAGTGVSGDSGDGNQATDAKITGPATLFFDSNSNLYVSEYSNVIRKISRSGIISTIAGNGMAGYNGDNQAATNASLNQPGCTITDNLGNIYISDCLNNRIRKVDVLGQITTFAGNGIAGFAGDGGTALSAELNSPAGLCFDKVGNLYIADHANLRIRKVSRSGITSTIAGSGTTGFSGDGGLAISAGIGGVSDICIDANNDLFMADNFSRVRKISLSTGIITTVAGTGTPGFSGDGGSATAAELSGPWFITTDIYGNMYISDNGNYRVRKINSSGIISTVAGNGMGSYNGDGENATAASIFSPRGVATDSCGYLYISDNGNNRIRKITYPKCGYLSTSETEYKKGIVVYPNPTNGELNINNLQARASYRLQNIMGTTVQEAMLRAGDNSISIQNLADGMYLLELTDEEGKKTISKIVKQ